MKRLRGYVIFALCVATSACGSGAKTTNISCDSFTACGGNIVGTWRVVSVCGSISSPAACPSEKITAHTIHTMTTYTFAGDGTFTATASGVATEELRYPLACLGAITDAGIPQACTDYERAYMAATQAGDAGTQPVEVTGVSCAAAGSQTCACTLVVTYTVPQVISGSYTASGNQLTLAGSPADGGVPDDPASAYCVSGNTLTIHSVSDSLDFVTTLTR